MKFKIIICIVCIIVSILAGGLSAYFVFKYNEKQEDINGIYSKKKKEETEINMTPINAELTAYCNCEICSEQWGNNTAMMTKTRKGVVAAPEDIPMGSTLYIPELKSYKEDGLFSVEDRGGAVIVKEDGTYIIDVWLSNHDDVINFGRKKCIIYLVNKE